MGKAENKEFIKFRCELLASTQKAWQMELIESGEVAWFPKSQCEVITARNGDTWISVPRWLAEDKELSE